MSVNVKTQNKEVELPVWVTDPESLHTSSLFPLKLYTKFIKSLTSYMFDIGIFHPCLVPWNVFFSSLDKCIHFVLSIYKCIWNLIRSKEIIVKKIGNEFLTLMLNLLKSLLNIVCVKKNIQIMFKNVFSFTSAIL